MDKEKINLGPIKGERFTLSAWEVQVIQSDVTCKQNAAVRELTHGLKEGDNLTFSRWGIIYKGAAQLIEKTLIDNGLEVRTLTNTPQMKAR